MICNRYVFFEKKVTDYVEAGWCNVRFKTTILSECINSHSFLVIEKISFHK